MIGCCEEIGVDCLCREAVVGAAGADHRSLVPAMKGDDDARWDGDPLEVWNHAGVGQGAFEEVADSVPAHGTHEEHLRTVGRGNACERPGGAAGQRTDRTADLVSAIDCVVVSNEDVEIEIPENDDACHSLFRRVATASTIARTRSTSTGASRSSSSLSTVPTMKPSASR